MKKLVLCGLFALTACGGGGGDDNDDFTSDAKIDSLVGVWDNTEDYGTYGKDVSYISIDKNGYLSIYDYAGDTFDEWGNCYWIDEKYAQLTHLSGIQYSIKDLETSKSGVIELTATRVSLRVTEADVDDIDEDGNTTETRTYTLAKLTKTVADLTPECVDSEAAARALIPAKREKVTPFN
jgi:hypothetical protein